MEKVKFIGDVESYTLVERLFLSSKSEYVVLTRIENDRYFILEGSDLIWFCKDFKVIEKEQLKNVDTKQLVINSFFKQENAKLKQRIKELEKELLAKKEADEWIDKIAKLKLEFDKIKLKMPDFKEMFKPLDTYHGSDGFFVSTCFNKTIGFEKIWANSFENFNSFCTKEAAEEARKHLQITCALLNFRAENDKDYDGKIISMKEYFSASKIIGKEIFSMSSDLLATMHSVLFSTKELAKSALEMLKRKGLI